MVVLNFVIAAKQLVRSDRWTRNAVPWRSWAGTEHRPAGGKCTIYCLNWPPNEQPCPSVLAEKKFDAQKTREIKTNNVLASSHRVASRWNAVACFTCEQWNHLSNFRAQKKHVQHEEKYQNDSSDAFGHSNPHWPNVTRSDLREREVEETHSWIRMFSRPQPNQTASKRARKKNVATNWPTRPMLTEQAEKQWKKTKQNE